MIASFIQEHFAILLFPSVVGLILVLGAMLLLYKGSIKLDRQSGAKIDDALVAELSKIFSIRAGNPVVSLFVIGLLLVISPLLYLGYLKSQEDEGVPIVVKGKLSGEVPGEFKLRLEIPVKKTVTIHPDESNRFSFPHKVKLDEIRIVPFAPGYHVDPVQRNYSEHMLRRGILDLKGLSFNKGGTDSGRGIAEVMGEVLLTDGKPAQGYEVYVAYDDKAIGKIAPGVTKVDGKFVISNLPTTEKPVRLQVRRGNKQLFEEKIDRLAGLVDFGPIEIGR